MQFSEYTILIAFAWWFNKNIDIRHKDRHPIAISVVEYILAHHVVLGDRSALKIIKFLELIGRC